MTILLATFNGAGVLGAQLESYLRQSHEDWSLIVSDDGSTDGTREVIQAFVAANPTRRITLIRGPGQGSAQNFLSLLRAAGPASLVAFSDQDDVWLNDKLARAVATIGHRRVPCVYGSRTVIADTKLNPLRYSPLFRSPPSFENALVQNIAGGNTMLLNRAALDALQPASRFAKRIVSHDWWCYQMVTGMGGMMIYDPVPSVLYRQHSKNQIGANDTVTAMIARLHRLATGAFGNWLNAHFDALNAAQRWLDTDALRSLKACGGLSAPRLSDRWVAFTSSGICRQTFQGSLALVVAVLFRKL